MDEGKTDVVYKKTPQRDLMLTFLPPIKKKYEKAPVYFIIPGGGWHVEDRRDMLDFSAKSVQALRNEGFAVVSIDYRVCGEGVVMREIIADCLDAARYIAHFSDKFSVDREKFALSGLSSGGHLALMLAYAPHDSFKDNYEFSDYFTVKCVAVMSPPVILYDNKTNNLRDMFEVFEGCDTKEEREFTSPITYVTSNCPPTLLCAGTSDDCVFASSSERLFDKLKEKNNTCEIRLSICGGHIFNKVHREIDPSINADEMQNYITDFILRFVEK